MYANLQFDRRAVCDLLIPSAVLIRDEITEARVTMLVNERYLRLVHETNIEIASPDRIRMDTEMALFRARHRLTRAGRHVGIAWAEPGRDFNDMLRSAA